MENYMTSITNYLLAQSWQIAILVIVIAAVNLILKNKSAHIRYLLWMIVLVKCFVPPLLTVPVAILPEERPLTALEKPDISVSETAVTSSMPVQMQPANFLREKPLRITTRQCLGLAWIVGVSVFVLFAVTKEIKTESLLRKQRKTLSYEFQKELEDLFSGLGLKTFPKFWLVEDVGQPFVWGFLRGSIYLPSDFVKDNSNEHRRNVLGHELSHFMRFDAAVNIFQIIAQAIFWFHPLVWWVNKKIRCEREKCCDEMTIARLGAKAKDYGAAIVDTLVAEYKSIHSVPSLAIAGPVRNIEDRLKTIMKPGKKFYARPSLIVLIVVLFLSSLLLPTMLVLTAQAETKTEQADKVVTCAGRMVNTRNRPIAGAKVTAYEMVSDGIAGNILLHRVGKVTTKSDGVFIFKTPEKPSRGTFLNGYIVATCGNLALGWTTWDMRNDIESDIKLTEPERLEGKIVDKSGKPVVGAQVRANLRQTLKTKAGEDKTEWLPGIEPISPLGVKTDGKGVFRFNNIPAGSGVDLLVKAKGKATIFTWQAESRTMAFKSGQTGITVVMPDEARIEGRIVDPDTGRGIAGIKFAVVYTGSGAFFYRFVCTTDDNGQFSIGGLQSSEYLIRGGRGDPLPGTYVNTKSGRTTKVTIRANKIYYGRMLFEDGSPVVITPEPWPGARTKIYLKEKGKTRGRSVVYIDKDGLFRVSLSQEQYERLQSGKAWFEVTIPYTNKKAYLEQEVFAYDLLATDKTKAKVAWIVRPNSEPGSVIGRLLFEPKAFNIDLPQTSTQGRIMLACFFDIQQRPSRYFLIELAKRAKQLKQKGVTVVAIQASKIDENALDKWVKNENIPFAVGMVQNDAKKIKFNWGIQALPWLILADRNRVISAEGFSLSELNDKIEAVAEK